MKIKFVDLRRQYESIKSSIDKQIFNVIDQSAYIGGDYVKQFEREFEAAYGVKNCVSVANGTDSLYIILKMLGIGAGDEVITVANSWISSSETISQSGAKPVFVDIDPKYYTIDESKIEEKITKRTKAFIVVHLYGQVCDMDYILALSSKYGIPIIEDCAQSHFSEYRQSKVGTLGIAGSFSFYPGKNLGAYGDAGCIITNDNDLADKCRMYSNHGALRKHDHIIEGINSRMDGLQAAILLVKLKYINEWTERRIQIANLYTRLLGSLSKDLKVPEVRPDSKHTFHLYVIRLKKRDELMDFLKSEGIETAIHYPRALPNLPCYNYLSVPISDYIIASNNQREILSLPIYPELTDDEVFYVVSKIKTFFSSNSTN
jgi:dTDP-4-amino-4,6-dideoxygalactose transaminase